MCIALQFNAPLLTGTIKLNEATTKIIPNTLEIQFFQQQPYPPWIQMCVFVNCSTLPTVLHGLYCPASVGQNKVAQI